MTTTAASGGTSRKSASAGEGPGSAPLTRVTRTRKARPIADEVVDSSRSRLRSALTGPSGLGAAGPSKNSNAWRAVSDKGRTPVFRRSPTCCNMASAAAASGASESSNGTDRSITTGSVPVIEGGWATTCSVPVAATSIWRLIRAAGSEVDRARSHVASVASTRALRKPLASTTDVPELRVPLADRVRTYGVEHDRRIGLCRPLHRSGEKLQRDHKDEQDRGDPRHPCENGPDRFAQGNVINGPARRWRLNTGENPIRQCRPTHTGRGPHSRIARRSF